MGHHFCETILEYMQVYQDLRKLKTIVADIEDIMNSQTQNDKQDKQSQLLLENDLKQQLGLIGGRNSSLMGPGGLSII